MTRTQAYNLHSASVTSSYVQRGDEQVFLKADEFTKVEKDVNAIMKSQAFAQFFSSLGKPMADVEIKVVGKSVFFSSGDKSIKLKSSEELETVETKTKESASLKQTIQKETATIEGSAQRIDALSQQVLTRFDAEDHDTTPGILVDMTLHPPKLTPVPKLPLFIPSNATIRTSSRKLIALQSKLALAQAHAAPLIKAHTAPYNVDVTSEANFRTSCFDAFSTEQQETILREVFDQDDLEVIGQDVWSNTSMLSTDYGRYKGHDKKQLGFEKLIQDPAVFAKYFTPKAKKFERAAKKAIYQAREAASKPATSAVKEIEAEITREKLRLNEEAAKFNEAKKARSITTSIPESADPVGLFFQGRQAKEVKGLGALLKQLPHSGDSRIIALQGRAQDEIHYDDLIYVLRHELTLITNADGSIDRSKAILFKPENKIVEHLLPLLEAHEGVDGISPLTKQGITEIAESKQAVSNLEQAYALALEYMGLEFKPENIGVKESEVVTLFDPDQMPHFALDDSEHSRIARMLLFPKEVAKATKSEFEPIPFFNVTKSLYYTLCKLAHSNATTEAELAKTSALGTSSNPGSWRKILAY